MECWCCLCRVCCLPPAPFFCLYTTLSCHACGGRLLFQPPLTKIAFYFRVFWLPKNHQRTSNHMRRLSASKKVFFPFVPCQRDFLIENIPFRHLFSTLALFFAAIVIHWAKQISQIMTVCIKNHTPCLKLHTVHNRIHCVYRLHTANMNIRCVKIHTHRLNSQASCKITHLV